MNWLWAWLARNMPDLYLAVIFAALHQAGLRFPNDTEDSNGRLPG